MNYKIVVFAPDKEELLTAIIAAGAKAGAGVIGNYTHCAWTTKGTGNWKSEEGSHPTVGKVGEISREPEAKVEMLCPEQSLKDAVAEIRKVHPYEEPEIDIYQLYNLK
jgi:hypothetical protein